MFLQVFIIIILIAIVASLAGGMVFLVKDKGRTDRTAKALTLRIVLSVSLFAFIMLATAMGWLKPHGIYPAGHPVTVPSGSQ